MSETAFEQWWIDQHGPNWKAIFAEWEKEHCEVAWIAAIDAASGACDNVTLTCKARTVQNVYKYEGVKECKAEIQKLRSE